MAPSNKFKVNVLLHSGLSHHLPVKPILLLAVLLPVPLPASVAGQVTKGGPILEILPTVLEAWMEFQPGPASAIDNNEGTNQ